MNFLHSVFSFIKSVFSEDGQGSYSRLFSGIIVLCTLAWITSVVIKSHALPDLTGPSAFIASGVGIHYGVNKFNDVVKDYKNPTGA